MFTKFTTALQQVQSQQIKFALDRLQTNSTLEEALWESHAWTYLYSPPCPKSGSWLELQYLILVGPTTDSYDFHMDLLAKHTYMFLYHFYLVPAMMLLFPLLNEWFVPSVFQEIKYVLGCATELLLKHPNDYSILTLFFLKPLLSSQVSSDEACIVFLFMYQSS